MENINRTAVAYLGMTVMTIIVGLSFIFVKVGLKRADAYDLLAHRFSAAFIVVVALHLCGVVRYKPKSLQEWRQILLVAVLYPVLFFLFQTFGMEYSSVANAGILMALLPVVTVVGGIIFLKEHSSVKQKTGIAISACGLVYIFMMGEGSDGSFSLQGSILLILSVLVMAAYYVKGKVLMSQYESAELTSAMILIGFVVFNLTAVVRHINNNTLSSFFLPLVDFSFLMSVLYLGILSSVLTSFLSNYALSHISTFQVSVFNNVSPVITIFAGVMLMNDSLSIVQIVGSVAVLAGVVMVIASKSRRV
jgi:drug/metabolite transporter (DMT)-like permease